MKLEPQKLVILAGPTAVGKTATLQKIQQYIRNQQPERGESNKHGIEVINCDSIQVYQYLDIGSAKPSIALRATLPHHLVDMLQPHQRFTSGYFVRQCDEIIPQIAARGNIPVISGGAIFYLKSFLYGLADIPPVSGKLRNRLEQLSLKQLGNQLKVLDAESFQRIHPHDKQRLVRACEVSLESDRPFSSYQTCTEIRKQYQVLIITLGLARELLYQRIDLRVKQMFEQGLEQEIQFLKQSGFSGREPGLQGIGYREFFKLNYQNLDRQQLIAKIQQNSRNYAKRQQTFQQQLPNWQEYSAKDSRQIAERITQFHLHQKYPGEQTICSNDSIPQRLGSKTERKKTVQ